MVNSTERDESIEAENQTVESQTRREKPRKFGFQQAQGQQNEEEHLSMQSVPYSEAVGSLLYLGRGTRTDIAYFVAFLSCFVANPCRAHWQAVKHLFRYLQGTKDLPKSKKT